MQNTHRHSQHDLQGRVFRGHGETHTKVFVHAHERGAAAWRCIARARGKRVRRISPVFGLGWNCSNLIIRHSSSSRVTATQQRDCTGIFTGQGLSERLKSRVSLETLNIIRRHAAIWAQAVGKATYVLDVGAGSPRQSRRCSAGCAALQNVNARMFELSEIEADDDTDDDRRRAGAVTQWEGGDPGRSDGAWRPDRCPVGLGLFGLDQFVLWNFLHF